MLRVFVCSVDPTTLRSVLCWCSPQATVLRKYLRALPEGRWAPWVAAALKQVEPTEDGQQFTAGQLWFEHAGSAPVAAGGRGGARVCCLQ